MPAAAAAATTPAAAAEAAPEDDQYLFNLALVLVSGEAGPRSGEMITLGNAISGRASTTRRSRLTRK